MFMIDFIYNFLSNALPHDTHSAWVRLTRIKAQEKDRPLVAGWGGGGADLQSPAAEIYSGVSVQYDIIP